MYVLCKEQNFLWNKSRKVYIRLDYFLDRSKKKVKATSFLFLLPFTFIFYTMKLSVLAATLLLTLATPTFSVPIEQAAESSDDGTPTTTASAPAESSGDSTASSSSAAPTASSSSAPGGGDDDLSAWIDEEATFAQKGMFANFNPEGSVTGFIAASPSKDQPVRIIFLLIYYNFIND